MSVVPNDSTTILTSNNDNVTKRKRDRNDNGNCQSNDNNQNASSLNDDEAFFESLVTPNFEELARQFPEFGAAYRDVLQRQKLASSKNKNDTTKSTATSSCGPIQSFITQKFTITLTKALLRLYFNALSIPNIPDDVLCPPVPNRYYFVRWIQKELLIQLSSARRDTSYFYLDEVGTAMSNDNPKTTLPIEQQQQKSEIRIPIVGLDIGTGATCIYPLLMVSSSLTPRKNNHNSNCFSLEIQKMYATDIDHESIEYAIRNVRSNPKNLSSKIQIVHVIPTDIQKQQNQTDDNVSSSDNLFQIGPLRQSLDSCFCRHNDNSNTNSIDFCMTNPPFYDSNNPNDIDELTYPRSGDCRERTRMKLSEGLYPGGEIGFILDMIVDGLDLFVQRKRQQQRNGSCHNNETAATSVGTPPMLLPPLPMWSSCMLGKKTSFTIIKHIIEQLLGFGHIQCTEFEPGHLTRWFIAWTFEKPCIRSPSAKLPIDDDTNRLKFYVKFNYNDNNNNGDRSARPRCSFLDDVTFRVQEYCKSFPDHTLIVSDDAPDHTSSLSNGKNVRYRRLAIREDISEGSNKNTHPTLSSSPLWPGDDALPIRLQQILKMDTNFLSSSDRMKYFVPNEGHFLIDIMLTQEEMDDDDDIVQVQIIDTYRHSLYGMKIIQKIKNQLEGEICQTNRRWRRKFKQQQPHGIFDMNSSSPQPMDET